MHVQTHSSCRASRRVGPPEPANDSFKAGTCQRVLSPAVLHQLDVFAVQAQLPSRQLVQGRYLRPGLAIHHLNHHLHFSIMHCRRTHPVLYWVGKQAVAAPCQARCVGTVAQARPCDPSSTSPTTYMSASCLVEERILGCQAGSCSSLSGNVCRYSSSGQALRSTTSITTYMSASCLVEERILCCIELPSRHLQLPVRQGV